MGASSQAGGFQTSRDRRLEPLRTPDRLRRGDLVQHLSLGLAPEDVFRSEVNRQVGDKSEPLPICLNDAERQPILTPRVLVQNPVESVAHFRRSQPSLTTDNPPILCALGFVNEQGDPPLHGRHCIARRGAALAGTSSHVSPAEDGRNRSAPWAQVVTATSPDLGVSDGNDAAMFAGGSRRGG